MYMFTRTLALFLLVGCASLVQGQKLWLRVSHTSPDTGKIDILLNDSKVFGRVAFQECTDYVEVQPGLYDVTVQLSGTSQVVLRTTAIFNRTSHVFHHTLALLGTLTNPSSTPLQTKLLDDVLKAPATGKLTHLRLVHASPDALAVDVRLDGFLVFSNVNYADITHYVQFSSGTFLLEVFHAGAEMNPILSRSDAVFEGGNVYTVFLEGFLLSPHERIDDKDDNDDDDDDDDDDDNDDKDNTLSAVIVQDAAYTYLKLRFSHASPDAGAVSVYAEDQAGTNTQQLISTTNFKQISDYFSLPVVDFTIKITQPSKPNDILAQLTPKLEENNEYTLSLLGFSHAPTNATPGLELNLIRDQNIAPSVSIQSLVRFMHASPGTPSVDVRVMHQNLFSSLSYGHASGYAAIPQGVTTFDVFVTGSTETPILSFTHNFESAKIYTVFLEGVIGQTGVSALSAIPHVDKRFFFFTMRIAHASPDAPPVDVLLDEKLLFSGISYGKVSDYRGALLEPFSTFKITPKGHHEEILYKSRSPFLPNITYTVSLVGSTRDQSPSPLDVLVSEDDNSAPLDPHVARVRFIHAATVAGPALPVDLRADDKLLFKDVRYRSASRYAELKADTYQIKLFKSDKKTDPLLLLPALTLRGGKVYTLLAEGRFGKKVHLRLFEDTHYHYTALSFSHAAAKAPAVDIYVNGQLGFTNLNYGGNTALKYFTVEDHIRTHLNVTVLPAGRLSPTLFSKFLSINHSNTKHVRFVLVGLANETATQVDVLTLTSDVQFPHIARNRSFLSVSHVALGAPPVDIIKGDGSILFSDLDFKETSQFKLLVSGVYENLQVVVHGTKQPLLVLPSTTFQSRHIYRLLIQGTPGSSKTPLNAVMTTEYVPPPPRFGVRVLHAASDAPPVDVLFNGQSEFYGVNFAHATPYRRSLPLGHYSINTVPTPDIEPVLTQESRTFNNTAPHTVLLMGSTKYPNATLQTMILEDAHTLPAYGFVQVRFVHASPTAPPVDITFKTEGEKFVLFRHVSYGDVVMSQPLAAGRYWVQVFPSYGQPMIYEDDFAVFGHDLDLRSRTSAAYTVVAAGFLGSSKQDFHLLYFLDRGAHPPTDHSTGGPLSNATIAVVVVGVVVAVVAVGGLVAFIMYRQHRWQQRRRGYASIPETVN